MPKLSTSHSASPQDTAKAKANGSVEPKCRPCPRCYVPLVLERQYSARGLSGVESVHQTYTCPACDARFQHNPSDGRWKELS
jgi:hypothetical protein